MSKVKSIRVPDEIEKIENDLLEEFPMCGSVTQIYFAALRLLAHCVKKGLLKKMKVNIW